MPEFFVSTALLPSGWAHSVLLSVDADGTLARVAPDAGPTPTAVALEGVAVPGIPNLHSHAFQRALAGLVEARAGAAPESFWSWRERMYALLTRLGPEDVEAVAGQLYVEMLKAGFTGVAEFHYLHHDVDGKRYADRAEMSLRLVAAARGTGIGLTLLPSIYLTGDFGGGLLREEQKRFLMDEESALELVARLGRELASTGGLRRLGLALHSLRAVPPEALERAVAELQGKDPSAPVHIHVAEQRREVEACLSWSGARPVEWLLGHAPVDHRWCLVHATHVTREESRRVAEAGAVVGLCPSSEGNLGDGFFPLRGYLRAGGAFGVGSDSHVSVSPVEELRWLEYGQRLVEGERNVGAGFPHASTGRSLLERVLAGGARALGTRTGALAEGQMADVVVLDPEHPSVVGRRGDALLDSWIFAGNSSPVRHVLVGGREVVRDGRHFREEQVLDDYRGVAWRLTAPTS